MSNHGLNIAQLAIYCALSIPNIYILIRHGWSGLLGWAYLFAFCTLRLVGAAIQLSADKNGKVDTSAAIISSIGLSPLLLATSGILHEARHHRASNSNGKAEWILVLFYHILVASGVGLIGAGSSAFDTEDPSPNDLTLLKVGIIILLVCWVLVCFGTVFSSFHTPRNRNTPGYPRETQLLFAVLLTLPFTGIRTIYSVTAFLSGSAKLNPVTGSLGFRVGLSFVPELISALIFLVAGLVTYNTRRTECETRELETRRLT